MSIPDSRVKQSASMESNLAAAAANRSGEVVRARYDTLVSFVLRSPALGQLAAQTKLETVPLNTFELLSLWVSGREWLLPFSRLFSADFFP